MGDFLLGMIPGMLIGVVLTFIFPVEPECSTPPTPPSLSEIVELTREIARLQAIVEEHSHDR